MKHLIIILLLNFFLYNIVLSEPINFDFNFKRKSVPAIRLDFGWDFSSLKEKDKETLTNSFNFFGLDLGRASTQDIFPIETKINYAFSKDTISNDDKQLFNTDLSINSFWGIGISMLLEGSSIGASNLSNVFVVSPFRLDGAGYKFDDNFSLKLLTGNNIAWYWLGFSYVDYEPTEEFNTKYADIEHFDGSSVRFGNKYRSEVSLQFFRGVSICAEANRMIIFPRTLFWKYLGSEVIFSIGGLLLGNFTDKIKTSNPYLYPVVDFLLRTGLNFGITELQKNKMNFPFNTASPIMIEQYRVGLQLEFSMGK